MATPDVIPDAKTEITAQRDEWLAAANGDVLLRLRIRRWASLAEVCAAAASGADVTSYSIAGRSVTKADLPQLFKECDALADQILDELGSPRGGVLVADMREAFG